MSNYPNSGKGLKNMFIASVGVIICSVLTVIPIVGIIAGIGALVFTIISLVGLWSVGKDLPECKTAFWLTLGAGVVNGIGNTISTLSGSGSVVGTVFSIIAAGMTLGVSYYVCTSVPAALRTFGAEEAAVSGDKAWKIILWTTAVSIIALVLYMIPVLNVIGMVLSVVAGIADLVGTIFYMIFLSKASKAFGA